MVVKRHTLSIVKAPSIKQISDDSASSSCCCKHFFSGSIIRAVISFAEAIKIFIYFVLSPSTIHKYLVNPFKTGVQCIS